MPDVTVVPANEASWDDLQAVVGTSAEPARCWCQRYKMAPGESWASVGASRPALRLREQTRCGDPSSDRQARQLQIETAKGSPVTSSRSWSQ